MDLILIWSVNKLVRAVAKWTKSCDKRLARLISKIHHTSEFKQYCHVVNSAQQCRLGEDFVHVGKSHVCSHKLDVKETNFSFTQFDGI